ncbi:MAG: NUDIX hydrolase [Eubacteriales bacterium]|nr:NUDIX hydrolase [Eubacteriales bacterium]
MSDYIMDMRRLVGHRPLLQAGASVLLEDERGRLLLQRRADCHLWGYHGGSVELDEMVEEAAKRELMEETGLQAEKLELFGVFSGPELHFVYPNGDEVSNIDHVYLCTSYTGTLRPQPGEVEELRFFAWDGLPAEEEIVSMNRLALRAWVERKRREAQV